MKSEIKKQSYVLVGDNTRGLAVCSGREAIVS
jgi:hypothetical protein